MFLAYAPLALAMGRLCDHWPAGTHLFVPMRGVTDSAPMRAPTMPNKVWVACAMTPTSEAKPSASQMNSVAKSDTRP